MKRNRTIILLLALTLVLAMSSFSWADTFTAKGGDYTFDGSKIVASGDMDLNEILSELIEPGDKVTLTLDYINGSDEVTEWYMENTVIQTLEKNSDMQGGYTYRLANEGPDGTVTELFNTREGVVGGEVNGAGQGLKQATNASSADDKSSTKQDYFFIQELQPGESGTTILEVGLDGESHINTYQEKEGEIEISYAVEVNGAEDIVKEEHITHKVVKTGDTTNIALAVGSFVAAVILLILGIISARKDRKDGDEA